MLSISRTSAGASGCCAVLSCGRAAVDREHLVSPGTADSDASGAPMASEQTVHRQLTTATLLGEYPEWAENDLEHKSLFCSGIPCAVHFY